jgi:arylsulfatase A-like enzyme
MLKIKNAMSLLSGLIAVVTLCFLSSGCVSIHSVKAVEKPNVIIIFTDDQGYGDLGCFGSDKIKTPHIDRMAQEGCKFTNFMVASPVCTPSRAALLTGCYPKRVGLHNHVLFPDSMKGLNPEEHTIADHLKSQGYATACFGKWHLGHHPETLPRQNGFDEYFGIPYSNDMNHPDDAKEKPEGGKILWSQSEKLWLDQESTLTKWNTPLVENETIIEVPVDQRTITRRYTDKAIGFIRRHQAEPFFVYLPHSMPHVPLYVPEDRYDPNPEHAYKAVIEHIDAEVGRVLDTLRELHLDKNTYVVFTSDNGPWLPFKFQGGSAGPLRGGKGTTFEGGQRVPCVMWGPGRIPAGTECDQLTSTLDLLPTIAALTETELPSNRKIDGLDISGLLTNPGSPSPRNEFLYYSSRGNLDGIRQGKWKLLKKKIRRKKNQPVVEGAPEFSMMLFDLVGDIGEKNNLAEEYPELVTTLDARMMELDAEIEQNARPVWLKD